MIARARSQDPQARRDALEEFCRIYWAPLYTYARRRGKSRHDTEDLVQSFVVFLIEKENLFNDLDPERGKLRSWLLTAFRNFMTIDWRRNTAQKRGGAAEFVPLDLTGGEGVLEDLPIADESPESAYDRQWAQIVVARARETLRRAHESARKLEEYEVLQPFLDASCTMTAPEAASQLGKTAGAVRVAIARMRNDYRAAIRNEISETMGQFDDVDTEMSYLVGCL